MAVPFGVPKKSKVKVKTNKISDTNDEMVRIQQFQAIAQAMCQALREYYQQSLLAKDGFITGPVRVLPNDRLKVIWK